MILKKFILLFSIIAIAFMFVSCGNNSSSFELPTRILVSDDIYNFGNYEYMVYDDETIVIVAYNGSESKLIIPETIDGKKVVEIGAHAFATNESIKSVRLSQHIEIIGSYAFYGCSFLSDIYISNNVWSIGESAFDWTPWYNAQTDDYIVVGDGVLLKYQGTERHVTIPDNVRHLSSAFGMNNDIVCVEMGDSVLTVGRYAFAYCEYLKHVKLGNNIVLIDGYAFENCLSLTSVDIPDKVQKIGEYAFNYCNYITNVRIGKSVKEIGANAFKTCLRVRSFSIPAALEKVGDSAFSECYSITLVFYGGTEYDFDSLELDGSNYLLKDAIKIYCAKD